MEILGYKAPGMAFKIRTEKVPEIPGNYKNKYRGKGSEYDYDIYLYYAK